MRSGGEGAPYTEDQVVDLVASEYLKGHSDALRKARRCLMRRAMSDGSVSIAQIEASIHEVGIESGEGAPEPDGARARLEGRIEAFGECKEMLNNCDSESDFRQIGPWCHEMANLHRRDLYRLPPEREAEAREPEDDGEVRVFDVYGFPSRPGLVDLAHFVSKRFDKLSIDFRHSPDPGPLGTVPVRIIVGRHGPGPDREAEIRADQTRKVLDDVRTEWETLAAEWNADPGPPMPMPDARRAVAQLLARLSPTDDSPTGDDR